LIMSEHPAPLANISVLLACSELKAKTLAAGLEALGAAVHAFPIIQIRGIADKSRLDATLDNLGGYSWIIFTSAYAVRFFHDRMTERGLSSGQWHNLQICAIGPATAAAVESAGLDVTLVPRDFAAEGILAALAERHGGRRNLAGLRFLLPRAREARELLPHALEQAGASVDVVPCYENILPDLDEDCVPALLHRRPDLLVFTSSSTVDNFVSLLGKERAASMWTDATVAVLGPITARTLTSYGKHAEIVPHESTIVSLLEAIRRYYSDSGLPAPDF
jgi:uroporphyrinogen III methyltransferase / synthase